MKEALCRAFCNALDVRRVPSGYAITTPYSFEDGDPIVLYALLIRHGIYQLEDAGVQIAALEAAGIDLGDGTRGEAFLSLLNEYELTFDEKAMVVRSPEVAEHDVGEAALKLLAFMLRLQDFQLLTPERVKRTWHDDAMKSIHQQFDDVARVEEHAPAVPEVPAVPADVVVHFNSGTAPLAVFLATSDSKALQALILKMELEKYQRKPCVVVLLVERAKQNPLREATYAMSQARLDGVLAYRGAETEVMMRLATYQNATTTLQ
ncbi:DUF1828 domain-containing protein [Rhizorhabdus argentea]|uniref:DUF1828 domain-containing protein n=1 Tax=Rhizorhabdus argentea TaxID=1387174 RepID=UPI0030ECED15